jgi:hypothetical protein
MSDKDTAFYLKELRSEECVCGRPKKCGRSFCYKCYASLPGHMKKALYNHIMAGYGEAYDEAVKWLE